MRLGRRLTAGIAEDPPAPAPTAPASEAALEATSPEAGHTIAPAEMPTPRRTPDPAVSGI